MADHSELKRLAVELTAANDLFNESPQDNEIGDAWSLANDRFTEAASPEVILALIAENDGLKTGFEAYEQVNAELKAEVEALRKDAGRYRWLRTGQRAGLCIDKWHYGGTGEQLTLEEADAAIDAAMGKGVQS